MFKLIVAGSRTFEDYARLAADLDYLLMFHLPAVEIVCGMCPSGADALAVRYARERGLQLREFPADWQQWGRAAGPIRNDRMAVYADALVAYWDGKSKGTRNMIRCAQMRGIRAVVRRF